MAFKRDDWNALIDKVNALITSNGLSAVPLADVAKGHVWKKSDVTKVRDKLTEICTNGPTFAVTLNKWSSKLISELEAAIDGCSCTSDVYTGLCEGNPYGFYTAFGDVTWFQLKSTLASVFSSGASRIYL